MVNATDVFLFGTDVDGAQVDDVELPAGRLGEEEDRLVAKRRAAKEVCFCDRVVLKA